ncbi:MAG: hypothetical protein JSU65_11625 [Candidatus Zixiibacteriota bacterium]|nr:MAG: hypothetical protein JSU65_11625 [candidate division Zixibacteria bacterium]
MFKVIRSQTGYASSLVRTIPFTVFAAFVLISTTSASAAQMQITVDATELPRKMLHTTINLDLLGDSVSLLYPKWIPAQHGPSGPVENMVGLAITDSKGEAVRWKRDWADFYRFFVFPNGETDAHSVVLSYICNQDFITAGFSSLGIIDWNCVVLYPEGPAISDIYVDLRLVLPQGWKYGSALPYRETLGDTLVFHTITFEELIDMPLICGVDFRTVELAATGQATYYLHMVAQHSDDLPDEDADSIWVPFRDMMYEMEVLFTRTHFDNYHFLLVLSDSGFGGGLEHRNSSLNGREADAMHKDSWYESGVPGLLAHEMVHAWCGKYRRPLGMATSDYQKPKNLDLLWVYEGLTTHLGNLLPVRAGFVSFSEFKDKTAYTAGQLLHQKGRRWQPLRDTQVAAHLMWGTSDAWRFRKRSSDYYREGALLWLEIDARIRSATGGKRSLDDFCGRFFSDGDPDAHYVTFQLSDIISILSDLAPEPWDSLLDARLNHTQRDYDTTALHWWGYRLGYTNKRSRVLEHEEERKEYHDLYESVGFSVNDDDRIIGIVPESPADKAGLYAGARIVAVNGKRYTYQRLENAVRNSGKTGGVTLLTLRDENIAEAKLEYTDGLRFFTLKPLEGKQDWLKEIAEPRTTE